MMIETIEKEAEYEEQKIEEGITEKVEQIDNKKETSDNKTEKKAAMMKMNQTKGMEGVV